MALEPKKLSSYPISDVLDDASIFVGLYDNGDGTFANVNYTPEQIIAAVLASTRKIIVASADGNTLTDDWLAGRSVTAISLDGQIYLRDEYFTQTGNQIFGINGVSFTAGAKILAML